MNFLKNLLHPRAFVLVCAGALVSSACQGEYPLAPTVCDKWCLLTTAFECGYESPSLCVRECEETFTTRCASEFETALNCVELHPSGNAGERSCYDFSSRISTECEDANNALLVCASQSLRD